MSQRILVYVPGCLLLILMGCGSGDKGTSGQSVESLAPEAKQEPAFKEQTRAPAVKSETPIKIETITSSLSYPWGIDFLPDQRMIVTEKTGQIRIVSQTGEVGDTIKGVPLVHFFRDGGLLDIALDPDFEQSRFVFWVYSEPYDTGFLAAIARGKLAEDEKSFEDVRVIYRATPPHPDTYHYGSRLLFDHDGKLLACFGERFHDEIRVLAQSTKFALGKVVRLNKDGSAAEGGPFAGTDALPELWAMGFRDPQGMTFNTESGDLWLSDHGPRGGDELNLVKGGHNYGWPLIAYGVEYSGQPVNGGKTEMEGMDQPVYFWDPAIAPSGIAFYDGALIPEWKGNIFVAALRGKHLDRLVLKDYKVIGEERLLTDLNQRIRNVKEGPDGALYVLTDAEHGSIIRISAQ